MTKLKRLFQPIMVGRVELKNRLVMLAIGTGYSETGRIPQRLKDFLFARAKGGVGLIITGFTPFNFYGRKHVPGIYDDNCIPGLRELTETIHGYGAKVAAQLTAERPNQWATDKDALLEVVGPTEVVVRRGAPKPRALTIEEIHQIVEEHGEGARRAREAGFDSVEFSAGIGGLINQFISPATNKRQDEYGGSFENRMRFLSEIIDNARKKAGEDYTLICRFSADEFIEGGYDIEGGKEIAPFLEKAGIHCLNIQVGWHDSPRALAQREVAPGSWVYLAEGIKKVVSVPVITAYRINDPLLAEKILSEGKADLIGMARALIADPEFPNKAKEGRFDDIRHCITCCRCMDQLLAQEQPLLDLCSVNASVGRESEYTIEPSPEPKKVLIIGGGPGGMEAARVAALRGHQVTLWEKENRLGGALIFARIAPYKVETDNLINYLTRQLEKSSVEIRLGEEATLDSVMESKPDAVIVATGAEPVIPDIPGVRGVNVATALEVLTGDKEAGDEVIIIGGGMVGCETAEFLAEKGRKVTILEMLERMGTDIGPSNRFLTMTRLRKAGIRMETGAKVVEITENGVRVMRNEKSEFFKGDSIVLAVGMKAKRELAQQLEGRVPALYAIGDCVEPRKIAEAIKAGFQVAREL